MFLLLLLSFLLAGAEKECISLKWSTINIDNLQKCQISAFVLFSRISRIVVPVVVVVLLVVACVKVMICPLCLVLSTNERNERGKNHCSIRAKSMPSVCCLRCSFIAQRRRLYLVMAPARRLRYRNGSTNSSSSSGSSGGSSRTQLQSPYLTEDTERERALFSSRWRHTGSREPSADNRNSQMTLICIGDQSASSVRRCVFGGCDGDNLLAGCLLLAVARS